MSDHKYQPLYVPPGRFVSGSMTQKRTTGGRGGNQPIPPEKQKFEFGVAVRKDSDKIGAFFEQLLGGAKLCYTHNPAVHPVIDAWTQNGLNGFSMKVSDGDQPNKQGQVNPNMAGCWCVWFSTNNVPATNNQNIPIDPAMIKKGYFVDVAATMVPNDMPIGDGVGIYMNCDAVRFIALGEEIHTGPSLAQIAASMPAAPALPPGATDPSMAPAAPGPMPGQAPQPQQQYAPPQPQQQYAPQPPVGNAPPASPAPGGMPTAAPVGQMPPGVAPQAGTVSHTPPPTSPVPNGGQYATPQTAPAGAQPPAAGMPPGVPTSNPQHPPYTGAMTPPGT